MLSAMLVKDSKPTGVTRKHRGAGRLQAANPDGWLEGAAHFDLLAENIGNGVAVFRLGQPSHAHHRGGGGGAGRNGKRCQCGEGQETDGKLAHARLPLLSDGNSDLNSSQRYRNGTGGKEFFQIPYMNPGA